MGKFKRRRGATLALVAACTLIIVILGFSLFFIIKLFGGGRELANATDAGDLNLAKQSIRDPSIDLNSFPNPDIRNNFLLLSEQPGNKVNLLVYNRLVMQALMVAMNAQDENTFTAGKNALKLWRALNEVGISLRSKLEDPAYMGHHFTDLADNNDVKMLGNNHISLNSYAVSYMKHGQSTNISCNRRMLACFGSGNLLPLNMTGRLSTTRANYFAGYEPFTVNLPAFGTSLTFAGVPVFPQTAAHLVSYADFEADKSDAFASTAEQGASLPPNSFRCNSSTFENKSQAFTGAVACAIVGSLNKEYPMVFDTGYIIVRNGPSTAGVASVPATTQRDIFSHELAQGVLVSGASIDSLFTTNSSLWDQWYQYNTYQAPPMVPGQTPSPGPSKPNLDASQQDIRDGSGNAVTDFSSITQPASACIECHYTDYTEPQPKPLCVQALDNLKNGYAMPGSTFLGRLDPSGFTDLEQYKLDVMSARETARTCVTVAPSGSPSGMKLFQHGTTSSAPSSPYNFGKESSAWQYMLMIDQVSQCATRGPVYDGIVQRCCEMYPMVQATDVQGALNSMPLKLGQTEYLCVSGSHVYMSASPPAGYVANTPPDGTGTQCGTQYDVMTNLVNTFDGGTTGGVSHAPHGGLSGHGDGNFLMPFEEFPPTTCKDQISWQPSSGYNNLLGVVTFTNSCSGGGSFCKPN